MTPRTPQRLGAVSTLIPPLAFWAIDRDDAIRQAIAWAHKEPRIVSAKVDDVAYGTWGPVTIEGRWWTVVLSVEWDREPEQEGFGW